MGTTTLKGYPFVDHVPVVMVERTFNLSDILSPEGYHSNQHGLMSTGCIKLMGYKYDAREYLTQYVVKTEGGDLHELYALNKANARGLIDQKLVYIMEVTK